MILSDTQRKILKLMRYQGYVLRYMELAGRKDKNSGSPYFLELGNEHLMVHSPSVEKMLGLQLIQPKGDLEIGGGTYELTGMGRKEAEKRGNG